MARPRKDAIEDSPVNVSEIEETKETLKAVETDPQTEVTTKHKSNVLRIEPKKKTRAGGTLKPEWQKEHDYDWEYVEGIFENILSPGEPAKLWFCKWPGDHDCYWEIPTNIPVSIPRMIAKHLEVVDCYHTFQFVDKPPMEWQSNDFTSTFQPLAKHFRSRFRPIGAFN